MDPRDLSKSSLSQMCHRAACVQTDFLKTDLDVIATLIDISQGRLQRNQLRTASRSVESAKKGIEAVRRMVSEFSPFGCDEESAFLRRCDELESLVTGSVGSLQLRLLLQKIRSEVLKREPF